MRTLLGNAHIRTLTKTSRAAGNLTKKPIGHQLAGHGKWKPTQPNEPAPTPLHELGNLSLLSNPRLELEHE